MSGIGQTIETDLVGELVELWYPRNVTSNERIYSRKARGRVRAVTCEPNGNMYLWLEIVDEECVRCTSAAWLPNDRGIGDVFRWGLEEGWGVATIRIIKEPR